MTEIGIETDRVILAGVDTGDDGDFEHSMRSEEHTSELQSQR